MNFEICKKSEKRCYKKKEAESVVALRFRGCNNHPIRVYFCDPAFGGCGAFHLTHLTLRDLKNPKKRIRHFNRAIEKQIFEEKIREAF